VRSQYIVNADLSKGVVVNTHSLEWVPSPQPGVERRMLDRDGGEVARATSIVRYAEGSSFPAHTHGGGEEFFVLEGVFSDEHGDYPTGTYVRNPIGSSHAPFTREGCTILVKLRQMSDPGEQRLVVNTNSGGWQPAAIAGLERLPLFESEASGEKVYLVRFGADAMVEGDFHAGGEELLVLAGTLQDEHGTYPTGTWIRQPDGSSHSPYSREGCTLWVKRGHLPPVSPE
jgi:anti-sigma factor ChrR (cupin superfamily)